MRHKLLPTWRSLWIKGWCLVPSSKQTRVMSRSLKRESPHSTWNLGFMTKEVQTQFVRWTALYLRCGKQGFTLLQITNNIISVRPSKHARKKCESSGTSPWRWTQILDSLWRYGKHTEALDCEKNVLQSHGSYNHNMANGLNCLFTVITRKHRGRVPRNIRIVVWRCLSWLAPMPARRFGWW